MPFIQVTWLGTEPPIRHTVSVAGPDAELLGALLGEVLVEAPVELLPAALLLVLELHPTMVSATAATLAAAPNAADLFLSPIAGTPSALRGSGGLQRPTSAVGEKLTGNFPIR